MPFSKLAQIILVLTGFLIFAPCKAQVKQEENSKPQCFQFRTGTFYSIKPGTGYAVRTGKIQRSYYGNGLCQKWKIEWISNCEMSLTFQSAKNDNGEFTKGDILIVTIIPINNISYNYTSKLFNKQYPEGKTFSVGLASTKQEEQYAP